MKWKRREAEEAAPEIYQANIVSVLFTLKVDENDPSHQWECVSDVFLGPHEGTRRWLYVDTCNECDGVRVRRIAEGPEDVILALAAQHQQLTDDRVALAVQESEDQ